jgi:hypothetical protein
MTTEFITRDIKLEEVRSQKIAETCLKGNDDRSSRMGDQVRHRGMSMSRQEEIKQMKHHRGSMPSLLEKESPSTFDDSIGGIIYPPVLNANSRKESRIDEMERRKESRIDEMERRETSNPLERTYVDEKLSLFPFLFCYEVEEGEWEIESRGSSTVISTGSSYSDQMLRREV